MSSKALARTGDKIPVEKFHVSETNVRADELFGQTYDDKILIFQLTRGEIVAPFKARPEGSGFGVFLGRRRFLAKKAVGTKTFTVGKDVILEDVDEVEAKQQSLIENLKILRKDMNPVTRARELKHLMSFSTDGIRGTARRLGISPQTLSEYLKILELSEKMLEVVEKDLLCYTDALHLARRGISDIRQDELAETLKIQGVEAFQKEFDSMKVARLKRSLPKGKYLFLRTTFDKVYPPDMKLYDQLEKAAKRANMKVAEYVKVILREHFNIP